MNIIKKEILHPEFKKFIGKDCIIKIGKKEYHAKVHFVGRNSVGHDVITTASRGIHYINNWNNVSIQKTL